MSPTEKIKHGNIVYCMVETVVLVWLVKATLNSFSRTVAFLDHGSWRSLYRDLLAMQRLWERAFQVEGEASAKTLEIKMSFICP